MTLLEVGMEVARKQSFITFIAMKMFGLLSQNSRSKIAGGFS